MLKTLIVIYFGLFTFAQAKFTDQYDLKMYEVFEIKNKQERFEQFCKVREWVFSETKKHKSEELVKIFGRYYSLRPICEIKTQAELVKNKAAVERQILSEWGAGSGVKQLPEIARDALKYLEKLTDE